MKVLVMVILSTSTVQAADADALTQGNAAYRASNFEEAAKLYESGDSEDDYLTRKYNAAVSWIKAGRVDEALPRLQDAEIEGGEELRSRARYNLGYCHFQKGSAAYTSFSEVEAEGEEGEKKRLHALAAAAKEYRTAVKFYRDVEPRDEDCEHSLAVTKTALKVVLDEIKRIEEERKARQEDEALKNPAELLRALIQTEKLHRNLARGLARQSGRHIRLTARRLRKAEEENRFLTEKLVLLLRKEPETKGGKDPGTPGDPKTSGDQEEDEERQRRLQAAEVLDRAVEAQKQAIVSYDDLEPQRAVGHHSAAIQELRHARTFFPIQLPQIVAEAVATQEAILEGSRELGRVLSGGLPDETKGAGFGKAIVEALKDRVLRPVAKLLAPAHEDELNLLQEEEDDVIWAAGLIGQAKLPPPKATGELLPPGGHPQPQLTPEETERLNEALAREGATAKEHAEKAREALASQKLAEALEPEENALAALRRIEELLPKPPLPLEARLKKLIERQKAAEAAVAGLEELVADARQQTGVILEESQREDSKEAREIAAELETRQDERSLEAHSKVQEGEERILYSAEVISPGRVSEAEGDPEARFRENVRAGKTAIREAVEALEEALALLSGEQPQSPEDQQGDQQQQKKPEEQQPQQDQGAYDLNPQKAREKREEMDRKRREEEGKLLAVPPSLTVKKDW